MKMCLLVTGVCITFGLNSFAQITSNSSTKESGKFNIGVEAGLPAYPGDIKVILGFSLKYELPVAQHTWFVLSGGYNSFLNNSRNFNSVVPASYGYLPFKAGIKYYAIDGLFVEMQSGITFATQKYNDEASHTYFAYAPGLGYTFAFGAEAGFRFEGWLSGESVLNQTSLRLAYRF